MRGDDVQFDASPQDAVLDVIVFESGIESVELSSFCLLFQIGQAFLFERVLHEFHDGVFLLFANRFPIAGLDRLDVGTDEAIEESLHRIEDLAKDVPFRLEGHPSNQNTVCRQFLETLCDFAGIRLQIGTPPFQSVISKRDRSDEGGIKPTIRLLRSDDYAGVIDNDGILAVKSRFRFSSNVLEVSIKER